LLQYCEEPKGETVTFDRALNAIIACAAVVIAVALVRREFYSTPKRVDSAAPVQVDDWSEVKAKALRGKKSAAPVTILEFMDVECPFCAEFQRVSNQVKQKFGTAVDIAYVHFPLPMHQHAKKGAIAAECARAQGRFGPYLDTLFASQSQIGARSWSSFGDAVGIPDSSAFSRCMVDSVAIGQVNEDELLANRVGAIGTPTIVINGWKLPDPPSEQRLNQIVTDILAGREPFRPK
jgi:protein-disulfide isomerase